MQLNEAFRFDAISDEHTRLAEGLVGSYGGHVTPADILGSGHNRPKNTPILLTRRLAQTSPPIYSLDVFQTNEVPDPNTKEGPLSSLTSWVIKRSNMPELTIAQYNSLERDIQEGLLLREDCTLSFSQLVPQLLTEQPQLTPIEVQA